MPRAAIDIGSNTVKFTAGRVVDGRVEVLAEDATITRLSAGLSPGGRLDPVAVRRTLDGLSPMLERIRELGIEDVRAVATAGLRRAGDPETFLDAARRELGLHVDVIDGAREAELSFRGATSGPLADGGIVLDVGGRSTELAVGRAGTLAASASLDVGTISLTEAHLPRDPPPPAAVAALRAAVRGALEAAPADPGTGPLLGVSGTVIALAGFVRRIDAVSALLRCVEAAPLRRAEVEAALGALAAVPAPERVYGDVIPVGRADVIVAGVALVLEVMDHYARDALVATARGLRHGLLLEGPLQGA